MAGNAIQDFRYLGSGTVKLQLGEQQAVDIGICSALGIKISTEEKTLKDYRNPGGGIASRVTRISDVAIEIDLRDLSPANIALALNGSQSVDDQTGKATIEALTQIGKEYKLIFEGINEVNGGAKVDVTIHRFKPSPTESLDLIGDDFATMKMKGSALSDASQQAGKSRYFTVVMDTNH